MNTNLARATPLAPIEAAADNALAREGEDPVVSTAAQQNVREQSMSVIAGFAVRDTAAEQSALDAARQERRARIEDYRDDRKSAIAMLQKRGITPLAVVPKPAWERICSMSGLFRISPDANGRIKISGAVLEHLAERAGSIVDEAFGALFLGPAMATCFIAPLAFDCTTVQTLVTAAAVFVASLLAIVGILGDHGEEKIGRYQKFLTGIMAKAFARKPHQAVLERLLPGGASPQDSDLRVKVALPPPPDDVAQTLLKAKGLTLHVAAVPEAIAFAEPIEDVLRRESARMIDSPEWRLMHDPIIYIEQGSAIAVIAQFGDFPIEQGVVNEVVNSEYLL